MTTTERILQHNATALQMVQDALLAATKEAQMKIPRYSNLQRTFNISYTRARIAWEACVKASEEKGYSPASKLENRLADVAVANGIAHADAKLFALEVIDAIGAV